MGILNDKPFYLASLWMLGAVLSFCLMAIAGREIAPNLAPYEIMFYRSLVGIPVVLFFGAFAGTLHQITFRKLNIHIYRNIFHFAGQNLWFYAVALIPLAQVFALEFSFPIWVALVAPFMLGERLTRTRITAAIVGFMGILFIARPGFIALNLGVIAAAFCAIGFAGSYIFTKILTRDVSITCILFWLTVTQAIFGAVVSWIGGGISPLQAGTVFWVILIGLAGLFAHYCITSALELAPAIIVAPMDFVRLPLIASIGLLLYGERIDLFVIIGAVMIIGANYSNIYFENKQYN